MLLDGRGEGPIWRVSERDNAHMHTHHDPPYHTRGYGNTLVSEQTCLKCGQVKPLSSFYPRQTKTGQRFARTCKWCVGQSRKAYQAIKSRQYYDENRNGMRDRIAARVLASRETPEGRAKSRTTTALYKARHPERARARHTVARAVRSGKLLRQPCESCGDLNVEAHHDDYTKPLEVRWLCKTHHGEQQRQIRRAFGGIS